MSILQIRLPMNRLVSFSFRSVCRYSQRVVEIPAAHFATAKDKAETAKSKSKKGSKADTEQSENQIRALLLQYYKQRTYIAPKLSEETKRDYSNIAKEYSRQLRKLHNNYEQRMADKIWLRDLAIEALPTEELRKQAVMTDPAQIPQLLCPVRKARFENTDEEMAW